MRKHLFATALRFAAVMVCAATFAHAEDLVVTYRVMSSAQEGDLVRGALQIKAVNVSGQALGNVNLRLEIPEGGGFASLVQLGPLGPLQTTAATAEFVRAHNPAESPQPLDWTATYTDAAGATREASVASSLDEEAAQ